MKMVSCKVMTIKTQKGYRWYQGHWGLLWVLGAIRGHQGVSGVYWWAGRECRDSGARRGIGGIREHWAAPRGVGAIRAHQGCRGVRGVLELAGSVGTQGPEGVYVASGSIRGSKRLGLLGASGGVKGVLELAGNVGTQGPERGIGGKRGIGGH